MALPLAAILEIARGASQASSAVAGGVGGLVQARQMFTKEEKKRLAELEKMKEEGTLGATEEELARVEGLGAAQRGAMLRQQEAQSAREAAMQGPAVSGRDIFLREQAAATTGQEATEAIRSAMREMDVQARAAQEAEIAALREQERAQKMARTQAWTGMVSGVVGAAGESAGTLQQQEFTREMELQRMEKEPSTQELLAALVAAQRGSGSGAPGYSSTYGGRL